MRQFAARATAINLSSSGSRETGVFNFIGLKSRLSLIIKLINGAKST